MCVDLEYFSVCVCVCVSHTVEGARDADFCGRPSWGNVGEWKRLFAPAWHVSENRVTRQASKSIGERFRFEGHCEWLLLLKVKFTFSQGFACSLLHANFFLGLLFDP
jgi:hypothetical protein